MKLALGTILTVLLTIATCNAAAEDDNKDYYSLLGVSRDADNREIRKAFKKLAVKLHPDKNQDDEAAHATFIKVARAYEVLRDPDTRKHYDLYGDKSSGSKQQYKSYDYYRNQFGIYDDDPLIATLSSADFDITVGDLNTTWFVNFYSPNCHHCHELAPTWRRLAEELDGVIRIGAVNCEEDYPLCRNINIQIYPTLLFFSRESNMYQGEKYNGKRTVDDMQIFVLDNIKEIINLQKITPAKWSKLDKMAEHKWVLFLCGDASAPCPEEDNMMKVAAALDGLVSVGHITHFDLCNKIHPDFTKNPIILWKQEPIYENNQLKEEVKVAIEELEGSDSREITEAILKLLPDPKLLDQEDFSDARTQLRLGADKPWLLCFFIGAATELSIQLKRLPALLPHMNIGRIHCAKSSELCKALHVSRYPSWGLLKEGGAFEMHHGRDVLHELVSFAKESSYATNLHALSPAEFNNVLKDASPWFIDWYAPWCPPCRRLMPELRRASQHFSPEMIKFGTIDCTLHTHLCSQQGIRSYPTTTFYNGTDQQGFFGRPMEQSIVDFVRDMLNPKVILLNEDAFKEHILNKPVDELWVVDFYAPWCGPCIQLHAEWRLLANKMDHLPAVKIAQVNCDAEPEICSAQGVRAYPTIRLYPLGSKGANSIALYNGHRNAVSLRKWVYDFLPSAVEELSSAAFEKRVLNAPTGPWLIDFYAPWCGHCVQYEPEFITTCQLLEGVTKCGKVNCELHRQFCSKQGVYSYPTVILYEGQSTTKMESKVPEDAVKFVHATLSKKKHAAHDEF